MPLSTHSLHFRVHTRVFLTLVVAIAALSCVWLTQREPASDAATDAGALTAVRPAPTEGRKLTRLGAHDLPPLETTRRGEAPTPPDHLLFLQ